MQKKDFEKRRKAIELFFDIIFWANLIGIIISVFFKVAYLTGLATVDIINYSELISNAIGLILIFIATRLAHSGHIAAGIIGIVVAILESIFAGMLGQVVGIFLGIDSVMYLINYKMKK